MRFAECDADRLQFAAGAAELVCASGFRKLIVDVFGQKFGRRVDAFEFAQVIEIAIVQRGEGGLQHFVRAADIDYDSVRIELSEKKAASTTNVAPCRACAGPNIAPRNEWAIMMWSRTSTENKGTPLVVRNKLGGDIALRIKQCRQTRRQIAKPHRWSKKRVKARIGKQIERGPKPLAVRPARPV